MNASLSTGGMDQNFTKGETNLQPSNDPGVNLDIPSIGRNSSLKLRMYSDEYNFDALLYICVRNDLIKHHHKSRLVFKKKLV